MSKTITKQMVRSEASMRLEHAGAPYVTQERETWHEQVKEAELVLNESSVVDTSLIPILSARAESRNISLTEMANMVLTKRNEYKLAVSKILAAQDTLINSFPIPEDYQDDKYWV